MAKTPTKEELVAKYGTRFTDIKELTFAVDFPNGNKSVMRLMRPSQYKAFMQTLEGAFTLMGHAALSSFQVLDKAPADCADDEEPTVLETLKGKNVTKPAQPVWKLDENGEKLKDNDGLPVPELDENGEQVLRPFPNIRIELTNGDIKELPRGRVVEHIPTDTQMLEVFEKAIWDNAAAILKVLFPEDESRFTQKYVDDNLNVPFLKTLFQLVVDMNGLDFLIPFIKDLFPAAGLLLEQGMEKPQANQ